VTLEPAVYILFRAADYPTFGFMLISKAPSLGRRTEKDTRNTRSR